MSDSDSVEQIMEIDEWLKHYRLNPDLEEVLLTFGVEVIEDVDALFQDKELLQKCKATMSNEDFSRFVDAYELYSARTKDDANSMNSESWAKVDSQISSMHSAPDKKLSVTSSDKSDSVKSSKKNQDAKQDKRNRRISAMDKKLTRAASLDLLIMLDCTGSMHHYIHAAKTRIRSFVQAIGATYPDIPLCIGFIGYRDIHDGAERRVVLPFQKDLAAFETLLQGIHTFGGGNPLTDLTGALQAAAEQDWSSAIRVLFHIGDYPCHGAQYHDNLYDRYPAGDPDGRIPEAFVEHLREQKVTYCFGQLTTYTDKMIRHFNEHVGGTGKYIHSAPMNSATMMEVITSSVTALLTTSLSSSSSTDSHAVNPREYELILEMPADWSRLLAERAVAYSLSPVTSIDLLCDTENEKVTEDFPNPNHVQLQCAPQPFGKGRSKLAYYARSFDRAGSAAKMTVLKDSVYASRTYATKEKFEEFLAPQRAALYLAATYNEVRPLSAPSIEFVPTRLLQFLARPNRPYFIEESYIPGAWERFNNNTGYCAPFPTPLGTHHEAVQAFSHWTHHVSGGRLMITDCQGCFDAARNAFVLTDPAVHCVSLLAYGGTNMGAKGFERFFKTHRCNDICHRLGLIPQAVPVK